MALTIDHAGKVALVTGAGAGIGREIARWMARAGALVAVIHDLLLTAGVYALFRFEVSPATVIALLTIEMLLESGQLGPGNVLGLLDSVGDLEWDVVSEIEASKPSIKAKKDFGQYKHAV